MSVLRYLAPQFLNEGRLYWLRSPLYIVSNGKQESYYYDDDEFNAARGSSQGAVTRCKGLGTLSPDQARNSMFTNQFQRMDKLEPTEEALTLLEQLMGESPVYRTKFLFENVDFTTLHE